MVLKGPDVKTIERLLSAKRLNVLKQCACNLFFSAFVCLFSQSKKRDINAKVQEKKQGKLKNLEVGCLFDFCKFSVL